MLSPNDYQKLASRTLIARPDREYTDLEIMLVWNALGVAGEAGEYADSVKKMIFHNHPLDLAQLASELGDLLWYVAASASKLGLDLETIMQGNLDKLARRYPDGYSASASRARVDVQLPPAQPEATGWRFDDYPANPTAAPSILDRYPMRQPDIGLAGLSAAIDRETAAQIDRASELAREQQRQRELQRAHGERLASQRQAGMVPAVYNDRPEPVAGGVGLSPEAAARARAFLAGWPDAEAMRQRGVAPLDQEPQAAPVASEQRQIIDELISELLVWRNGYGKPGTVPWNRVDLIIADARKLSGASVGDGPEASAPDQEPQAAMNTVEARPLSARAESVRAQILDWFHKMAGGKPIDRQTAEENAKYATSLAERLDALAKPDADIALTLFTATASDPSNDRPAAGQPPEADEQRDARRRWLSVEEYTDRYRDEALAEPVKLGGLAIDPSELAINAEAIRKAWRDGIQDVLKAHAEQIEQATRELGSVNRASARAAGALAELTPAILRAHVSPADAEALARLAALTPDPYLAPALENAGRWLAADWAQVEADLASEMRQRLAGGVYVHLKWAGTPDAGEPGTTDPALVGQLASLVLSDEQPASPPANPLEALANAMRERQTISDGRYLRLRKASELDQEQPAASPEAGTLTDEQLAPDDEAAAGATSEQPADPAALARQRYEAIDWAQAYDDLDTIEAVNQSRRDSAPVGAGPVSADALADADLARELSGLGMLSPTGQPIGPRGLAARVAEAVRKESAFRQTLAGGQATDGRTTDDE